jgi:hypothetical protein
MDDLTIRFIDSYNFLKENNYVNGSSDFATKIDVSTSMVTEIVKGRSKPGSKALQNIVKEFPIDATWLLIGQGNMLRNAENGAYTPVTLLHDNAQEYSYSASTPKAKSTNKTQNRSLGDHPTDHPTQNIDPFLTRSDAETKILLPQIITVDNDARENILHVSLKVAAGYVDGTNDPQYLERLPSFRLPGLNNGSYRSFEVDGDSMFPTLKSGEMVIGEWLEKLDYIREDRVHIIVLKHGKPLIKRLLNRISTRKVIVAKSDATNNRGLYKNIEIDPADVLEVWYARFHGGFDFQSPSDMWNRVNNHEADLTILQNQVDKLLDGVKSAGLIKE